jgi:hypothetical protein
LGRRIRLTWSSFAVWGASLQTRDFTREHSMDIGIWLLFVLALAVVGALINSHTTVR